MADGAHHYIVSKDRDCCDTSGEGGYGLRIKRDGVLSGEIWVDSVKKVRSVDSIGILPTGVWSHVVMTFDGITLRLYVNGVQDGETVLSATDTIQASTKNLVVGALSFLDAGVFAFDGAIDDVRIYNRALTAIEISDLFNAIYEDPTLIFYESFENQQAIEINGGVFDSLDSEYVPMFDIQGKQGNAVVIQDRHNLSYPALDNINSATGTISFWFKPDWDETGEMQSFYNLFNVVNVNDAPLLQVSKSNSTSWELIFYKLLFTLSV